MIYNVQILRAFAATLVLFVHLDSILGTAGLTSHDLQFGNVGVDLFFVISGFVMVHTLANRPVSARAFMVNRIIRVVPLYWVLTIAVFALAFVAPNLLHSTKGGWIELTKSLLFVPFRRANGVVQPILFLGWTLNYEMFFYAVFAFSIYVMGNSILRTVIFASALLLLLVVIGLGVGTNAGLLYFYLYPITLEFGYGMVIALLAARLTIGRTGGVIAVLIGSVAMISLPFVVGLSPRYFVAGLPAAVILIGALAIERGGLRIKHPALQLLGGASYALYLTHPFVFQAVAKLWPPAGSLALVQAAVSIVAAQIIAVAVHLWFEKPLTDIIRRWTGHRPSTVAAVESRALTGADARP